MSFSIKISGSIAQVTMDNAPVNALSQASRQGLMDALVQVKEDSEVRAVVLRGKGGTFCAGADVREFSTEPIKPYLPDVLSTIENSRKPWIAAIDGFALGEDWSWRLLAIIAWLRRKLSSGSLKSS